MKPIDTTTISVNDPQDGALAAATRPCVHLPARSGDVVWSWIALAYVCYWALFVAGFYARMPQLTELAAPLVLAVLGWISLDHLWVRLDGVAFASLGVALITALNLAAGRTPHATTDAMKLISLCLVIAMSRILLLPPASASRSRGWLAGPVLFVLALCLFVTPGSSWDSVTRHSGLFINPNTLALIPFLLLLLIDRDRDSAAICIGVHALVVAVLAFTGTSGAVVAYAIGLSIHLSSALPRVWRVTAYALFVIAGSLGIGLIASGRLNLLPETRLTKQLLVIDDQARTFASGGKLNFYVLEQSEGAGSTSGLWRMLQWQRVIGLYSSGTPQQLIFGQGAGTSTAKLGKPPHNEYLRLLLEEGAVGLALFVFVWVRMIRSAPHNIRYVGLIFAIYSITENNLDNFPFMSVLSLCLSAFHPPERGGMTGNRVAFSPFYMQPPPFLRFSNSCRSALRNQSASAFGRTALNGQGGQ